jgi:hypothetical protein
MEKRENKGINKRGEVGMNKILAFIKTNYKKILKVLNIRIKLMIGLLVPVILLGTYGFISYSTSEKAIIGNYEMSSAGTLNAVSDYLGFGRNTVSENSLELVSDTDVRVYYKKRSGKEDQLVLINLQSSILQNIQLTKKTNSFIVGIHIFGENGKDISTEARDTRVFIQPSRNRLKQNFLMTRMSNPSGLEAIAAWIR